MANFKVKNGLQAGRYLLSGGVETAGSESDLSAASLVSSFSTISQMTNPSDVHFKPDGTKMYILGNANRFLYQYSLSTAWDVSTASYDSVSLNTDTDAGIPYSFYIKPDGTILYINTSNGVFQYTMSTAWDLSTVSYANKTTARLATWGMWLSSDGLTFYNCNNGLVYQGSLSTAWDISTSTGTTSTINLSAQEATTTNVSFNASGTKMYLTGITGDAIYQYSLGTAFDISTASYDDKSFSVHDTTENFVYGSFYDVAGDRLYLLGLTNDFVHQYSTVAYTQTLDLSTGTTFSFTPSGATTVSFTNAPASGKAIGFSVEINGDGSAITWPSSVKWPSGVAPTATASKEVYAFVTTDGGTSYYGKLAGSDIA